MFGEDVEEWKYIDKIQSKNVEYIKNIRFYLANQNSHVSSDASDKKNSCHVSW